MPDVSRTIAIDFIRTDAVTEETAPSPSTIATAAPRCRRSLHWSESWNWTSRFDEVVAPQIALCRGFISTRRGWRGPG